MDDHQGFTEKTSAGHGDRVNIKNMKKFNYFTYYFRIAKYRLVFAATLLLATYLL